jgi:hypothetical protein
VESKNAGVMSQVVWNSRTSDAELLLAHFWMMSRLSKFSPMIFATRSAGIGLPSA